MAQDGADGYHPAGIMMTILLAIVGTLLVFAWGFTIVQWKRTSEGYEDEQGFHFGPDPRLRDGVPYALEASPVRVDRDPCLTEVSRD